MPDYLIVDHSNYDAFGPKAKARIRADLAALGVPLHDCREAYVDESYRVVGCLRYLRNDDGSIRIVDSEVVTETVGMVPS